MLVTKELEHRAAFKRNMSVAVKVSVFLLLSYFVVLLNGERCSSAVSHAAASFEEIKHYIEELKTGSLDIGNYSVLSIDGKHNNLLVGGRDNAFLVDLDNFTNILNWNLPQSSGLICNYDRQDLENAQCNTFIEVMLLFKGRILICWTGASPACSWRNRTNLVDSSGKDKSGNIFASSVKYSAGSLSQHGRNTALLTERGRLFMVSRKSDQPSIYSQSFKQPPLKYVSSSVAKTSLNDDIHFVRSFNVGPYVYFFFRERILECFSCGVMQVSRVARICKGDYGGAFSLSGKFVTFQKATISCAGGKDNSLNFNEIQDVSWDQQSDLFYTVFSSHQYGPVSSAICIYKLSDIQQVFDGSQFLKYDAAKKTWSKVQNRHIDYFKNCKINKTFLRPVSEKEAVPKGMMATAHLAIPALIHLTHSPLMDRAVQPVGSKPWFMKAGVRMTGVTVDKINRNTILYTSTDRGSVFKIFQPTDVDEPCIMYEMHVFPTGKTEDIKEITIDTDRHVLYLGSDNVLSKLSLEQCSSHGHQSRSCLLARDPYCGWDKETKRCVSVRTHRASNRLKQDLSACPHVKEAEVSWSHWSNCRQSNGNLCRCRVRTCRQGSSCESGYEYQLENCTVDTSVGWEGVDAWQQSGVVHGNWSEWGQWSQCSVKSWVVLRHRTRTCNDPVPLRGGRPCTGDSVEYESCPLNLEAESRNLLMEPLRVLNRGQNRAVKLEVTCRAEGYRLTNVSVHVSTHTTIDCEKEKHLCEEGEWGDWSPWSECSSLKVKLKRRYCAREPCIGNHLQETGCTPIDSCADGADGNWGRWSSCVCKHDLNLERGVRYRVPKCRFLCPNEQSCPDKIQFDSAACPCNSVASAIKGERTPPSPATYGIGHVIGAAIVGCVVAVVLCIAAIFYVGRRKKQLNVSREEETSRDIDTSGSGAKYSTVTRENGTTLFVPPSPSNQSTESKDRNKNTKIKGHSPIKNLLKAREYTVTGDTV